MGDYRTAIDFVEGRLSAGEFERYAYGPEFEALTACERAPAYAANADSLYTFIISLSFSSPGDLLTMQAALKNFLESRGQAAVPTERFERDFDLFLSVQPSWLRVPEWYMRQLREESGGRQGAELKSWLRSELTKRFQCVKKKPSWLQEPEWPFVGGAPLVFLGQLDTGGLFHDKTFIYLFCDPRTGQLEMVRQSA